MREKKPLIKKERKKEKKTFTQKKLISVTYRKCSTNKFRNPLPVFITLFKQVFKIKYLTKTIKTRNK